MRALTQAKKPSGDWRHRALCAGAPQEIFFPEFGASGNYGEARKWCAACPVSEPCLEFAMETGEGWGMWGGTTPRERYKDLSELHRVRAGAGIRDIPHGTSAGYYRHLRAGTQPCYECTEAHRVYSQGWKAAHPGWLPPSKRKAPQ